MRSTTLTCVVSLVLAVWSATGCARSPEAQKARYLERGDTYAKRAQYREAVIEYHNVLRYEPANPRAIRQLGVAYFQMEQFVQAFRYLLKAQELAPDDLDVRLKLGAIYLGGGKLEQARSQATYVLGKEPRNVDALGLLADTSATPDEIRAAIQRLEEARSGLTN